MNTHRCIQGRASDVVVWKANQQYPIAVLHQSHGITVPAVAIERSPWGQRPQAEALRLVSCSDTGKASPPPPGLSTDAVVTMFFAAYMLCGALIGFDSTTREQHLMLQDKVVKFTDRLPLYYHTAP